MPNKRPNKLPPPKHTVVDDATARAVFVGKLRPDHVTAWKSLTAKDVAIARAAIARAAEVRLTDGDIAAERLLEGVALTLFAVERQRLIDTLVTEIENLPSNS